MATSLSSSEGFTPKEDSPSVLFKGTGTPYLAIFNGSGKPIYCQKHQLPIGIFVKSFEYVYEEDKEDTGEIHIETDNPDLIDHVDLQYYSTLLLQWGYIYTDGSYLCGPPRKVIIIGHSINFTSVGVTISLKLADIGILLKTVPANYYNNMGGFEDYIKDLLDGHILGKISMIDYSNLESKVIPMVAERVVDNDTVVFTQRHSDQDVSSYAAPSTGYPVVYDSIKTPNQKIPNMVGVTLMQYNPESRELMNQFPDKYRQVWVRTKEAHTTLITGISKNKYQQIKDFTRTIDNGPWSMDFRDGTLTIHNRITGRPLYKTYTYAGGNGELLEFTVKSEFVESSMEVGKSVNLDPETKSIDTTVVQGINHPFVGNIDGYIAWQQGFPFNGGSTDPYLNHASNNLGDDQMPNFMGDVRHLHADGTPMTLMERHQDFFLQDTTNTITPASGRKELEFQNRDEAVKYIEKNWTSYLTQEDLNAWFTSFKTQFDTWVNSNDLSKSLHEIQDIPNYIIKVKVKLKEQYIPDMVAVGMAMLTSGNTTEELVNQLQAGELNLDESYGSFFNRDIGTDVHFSSYGSHVIEGERYRISEALQKVQEVFKAAGGSVQYTKQWDPTGDLLHPKYIDGKARYEVLVELPIPGINLIADSRIQGAVESMGADIEETVTNSMEATAIVVGDPILESSFNIQIQNVSKKYSGVWYTKKVVHRLSPEEGYKCDIDFVQRSVPVQSRVIKSSWVHSSFAKDIHNKAKKTLEKGNYTKTQDQVMQQLNKYKGQSISLIYKETGFTVQGSADKSRADRYSSIPGTNDYVPYPDNYVEVPPQQD